MWRKIFKITFVVVIVALIVVQFIRPNFSNPPVVAAETLYASTEVPNEVQQVLARSCIDCHSNETRYPWYSKISPFSWLLANHIDDGRRELNFSLWNTYSPKKKVRKLEELCEQVEQSEMPLPSYLWIHREAVMADGDAALLCSWAKTEGERITGMNAE